MLCLHSDPNGGKQLIISESEDEACRLSGYKGFTNFSASLKFIKCLSRAGSSKTKRRAFFLVAAPHLFGSVASQTAAAHKKLLLCEC